ncbi:MAG: ComEA family DNA-binding protein [Phycisphaerae bacterium]
MPRVSDCDDVSAPPYLLPPALFSIAAALVILLVWIGYDLAQRPVKNQFSPAVAARITESSINPNSAKWASLVRIPGIGPGRAQKLLAWRHAHRTKPSQIVFHSAADLRNVPSFGPKTVAQIAPYLRFPAVKAVSALPPPPVPSAQIPKARSSGNPPPAHGRHR